MFDNFPKRNLVLIDQSTISVEYILPKGSVAATFSIKILSRAIYKALVFKILRGSTKYGHVNRGITLS